MHSPEITIDWCNLSSYSDDWLLSAFDEFRNQLRSKYPQLSAPQFTDLPSNFIERLPEYLIAMLPGNVDDGSFSNFQSKTIFIFCDGDEDFSQAYQAHNELAHWGVAIPCTLAIAWEPNEYLIWHEMLHLMNAKDCYNKFGINKCPNSHCIMRRAPSSENCGGRLTLCSKNVKRIERFGAEVAAMAGVHRESKMPR